MSSGNTTKWLDLERDLPTTAEDVAALRRLRYPKVDDYLAFLASFEPPPASHLRSRRGPAGEPFDSLRVVPS